MIQIFARSPEPPAIFAALFSCWGIELRPAQSGRSNEPSPLASWAIFAPCASEPMDRIQTIRCTTSRAVAAVDAPTSRAMSRRRRKRPDTTIRFRMVTPKGKSPISRRSRTVCASRKAFVHAAPGLLHVVSRRVRIIRSSSPSCASGKTDLPANGLIPLRCHTPPPQSPKPSPADRQRALRRRIKFRNINFIENMLTPRSMRSRTPHFDFVRCRCAFWSRIGIENNTTVTETVVRRQPNTRLQVLTRRRRLLSSTGGAASWGFFLRSRELTIRSGGSAHRLSLPERSRIEGAGCRILPRTPSTACRGRNLRDAEVLRFDIHTPRATALGRRTRPGVGRTAWTTYLRH